MDDRTRQEALAAARNSLEQIHSETKEFLRRLQFLEADLSTPELSPRTIVWVEEDTRLALQHILNLRSQCEILRMTVLEVISPSGLMRAVSEKGKRNE